jgi:hypothetical protein
MGGLSSREEEKISVGKWSVVRVLAKSAQAIFSV